MGRQTKRKKRVSPGQEADSLARRADALLRAGDVDGADRLGSANGGRVELLVAFADADQCAVAHPTAVNDGPVTLMLDSDDRQRPKRG